MIGSSRKAILCSTVAFGSYLYFVAKTLMVVIDEPKSLGEAILCLNTLIKGAQSLAMMLEEMLKNDTQN